ncbi:unnamed protein product [Polarella glacialis]|uniref:Uncharacterized protein n=1 Tax=Polarella glacialis TaxID=89957 RepID=A0A813GNK6_POLGL|nr:unnamed protein product [Polarella glacialis]
MEVDPVAPICEHDDDMGLGLPVFSHVPDSDMTSADESAVPAEEPAEPEVPRDADGYPIHDLDDPAYDPVPLPLSQQHVPLREPELMKCKVNLKRAMDYACTEHAMRTNHGCLSHSRIVMSIIARVRADHLYFYIKESKTATELGVGMRLQSGLHMDELSNPKTKTKAKAKAAKSKGKGKDKGKGEVKSKGKSNDEDEQLEVPPQLKHEVKLGLNIIGMSLTNLPKEIQWAMLSGMEDCYELDLDCAHHQCIALRHGHRGIPETKELLANKVVYRSSLADLMGVTSDDAKMVMLILTYAGSPAKWQESLSVSLIPQKLKDFATEMKHVHRLDSLHSPDGLELATSQGRLRPAITNHCWQNEASERWLLESLRAAAGDQCFTMPRGDGAILQGVPRGRIVKDLSRKGISVSVKELPRTWLDFSNAVEAAAGEKKRSFFGMQPVCTFDELRAVENARVCLLQPKERRDDTTIARSIMPFVSKRFCETSITAENKEQVKNTEWFNMDERRWHSFGGDDHLDWVVEDSLRSFFSKPLWQFVTRANEYGFPTTSLRPVPDPTNGICGHMDFIKKIRSIVSQLMRTHKLYKSVPLNSLSSKLIHFDCGKTLDFSMIEGDDCKDIPRPYEQQLREGMPEDRNTKHTGNRLPPCDQVLNLQIAEVCKLYESAARVAVFLHRRLG